MGRDAPMDIVSRDEWAALEPRAEHLIPPLNPYVTLVSITSTATAECSQFIRCAKILQDLQQKYMELGLADIPYNFLVSKTGQVFEGRGWDLAAPLCPQHKEHQGKALHIGFIGEFVEKTPSSRMFAYTGALLTKGMCLGKISSDFKILEFVPFAKDKNDPEEKKKIMNEVKKLKIHKYNKGEKRKISLQQILKGEV